MMQPATWVVAWRSASVERLIEESSRGLVFLVIEADVEAQVVFPLPIPKKAEIGVVEHMINLGPLQCGKDVVLIRR